MKNLFTASFICVCAITAFILLASCQVEPNSGIGGDTAFPGISLGGSKDLSSAVSSMQVSITHEKENIDMREQLDLSTGTLALSVPAANNVLFEVTGSNATSSFYGSATEDLKAGSAMEISITPDLDAIKLLVPDRTNDRIVQIDDIDGTGWIEKGESFLSLESTESIVDLAYDEYGRIYVAIYNAVLDEARILRMDDIGSIDTTIYTMSGRITALAVDRNNNKIYFGYEDSDFQDFLASIDYSGSSFDDSYGYDSWGGWPAIEGIAVGNDGIVYLARDGAGDAPGIVRYDPATMNITENSNIYAAVDVAVKNGYVYIADPYHSTSPRLERLPVGFSSGETPDTLLNDPQDGQDTFLGPYYFIHSLSDGLYILDEPIAGTLDDGRIVRIDDISGNGWSTFKASDIGKSEFDYYVGS